MIIFPFVLLLSFVTLEVGAQPAPAAQAASQPVPEQRRAELRQVLKTSSGRESQSGEQTPNSAPEQRHLSAQERADLRQQLRQQRPEGKPDRR